MIRTRKAEALAVGLVVAAIAVGSAAAATPGFWLRLHARLAPVAGTTAVGRFDGTLVMSVGQRMTEASSALPQAGSNWRLTWRLSLPPLAGPVDVSLRVGALKGASPVARLLCTRCSRDANGAITLTASQALRVSASHAVVVVRTSSASLRGPVKVFLRIPVPTTR